MKQEALAYARMPFALLSYLRAPRPADPLRAIELQREARALRFLDTLERTIFRRRDDSYRRMFELAGCTFGDFAAAVTRDGVEAALEHVRRAGVFLTHDEFKGHKPVVRSGTHVPTQPSSFDNPLVRGGLITFSSGSRGKPIRTRQRARGGRAADRDRASRPLPRACFRRRRTPVLPRRAPQRVGRRIRRRIVGTRTSDERGHGGAARRTDRQGLGSPSSGGT